MRDQKLGFIGQLDSFRFLAVSLVMISHWISNSVVASMPFGYLGVTFFFVLSGFLISFNLFVNHQSIVQNKLTKKNAIIRFYIRRSLRIFPLYFLVLGLIWLANKSIFEGNIVWFLTYTSNFLFFFQQEWQQMLSHFWSLGVEEQFYLVWPFLILFVPTRYILKMLLITISASIGYKLFMLVFYPSVFQPDLLPIAAFDAFGLGAILAYEKVFGFSFRSMSTYHLVWALPVFLVLVLAYVYGYHDPLRFFFPYLSVLLIHKSLKGFKGLPGYLLNNKVIMYFGRISYGLYIYHNFIPWLTRCLRGTESKFPIAIQPVLAPWQPSAVSLMIFQFFLLIVVASFSWFLFERPLNNLKKYF